MNSVDLSSKLPLPVDVDGNLGRGLAAAVANAAGLRNALADARAFGSVKELLRNHPKFQGKIVGLLLDEVGIIETDDYGAYFPHAQTVLDRYSKLWNTHVIPALDLTWPHPAPDPRLAGTRRVFGVLAGKDAAMGIIGTRNVASRGRANHLRLEPAWTAATCTPRGAADAAARWHRGGHSTTMG